MRGQQGDPQPTPEDILARLFRDGRANAITSWVLVAVLFGVLVESIFDFDLLWLTFVAVTGAIVVVPPLAARNWRMMLPWELLVLALLPILVRATVGGDLGTFAFYLSIAALALIVTVELHMFTSLSMSHWFAVVFVAMTTMASVAAWTVLRWFLDRVLGTDFLETNEVLMDEWVAVALAGLVAGVVFDAYFRRRGRRLRRRLRRVVRR